LNEHQILRVDRQIDCFDLCGRRLAAEQRPGPSGKWFVALGSTDRIWTLAGQDQ
jgi:hypothetical protein